ncbi:hypothetical protein ACXM2N_03410 [Corynebacterium sp. ZY180755]
MTTLADMTPARRYDCVGMWATVSSEHDSAVEHYLAVIARIYVGNPDYAHMYSPEIDEYYTSSLESVTPRFDLPRAWSPCGTPPDGEWLAHGTHTRVIPKNRRAYVTMSEPEPSQ